MTNLEALKAKCTRICSAFYADRNVLLDALFDTGVDPDAKAVPKDTAIIKQAIILVKGFVETGRSQSDISISVDREAVNENIIFWCKEAGLDASEFIEGIAIRNGSNLW